MSHDHSHSHGHSHSHSHSHDHARPKWDDKVAADYADKYGTWPTQSLVVERLELADGATVVDVGCGTGATLALVLTRCPSATCVGVDAVAEMVRRARENLGERAELYEADAGSLPLDDGSADLVLFVNTLHHVDPKAAMREAARVLKPGGKVVVATDEQMYDLANWSNGRVRDELSRARLRGVRQTSAHRDDVVTNILTGTKRS